MTHPTLLAGDRDQGFRIEHLGGRIDHTPTISEARAECGEYDARVDRVRCRTEVRVWYRDLVRLRRALDLAHASPRAVPRAGPWARREPAVSPR